MTAKYARHTIPDSLKDSSVFLSIDDTMIEKYSAKFEARSKLFDHATHNGSNYLNGHCFVSVMLHVPISSPDGITYLSVSLGCRLWTKEETKLELTAQMIHSVMPVLASHASHRGIFNLLEYRNRLLYKSYSTLKKCSSNIKHQQ